MKRKGLIALAALWLIGILFPMAWVSGRSEVLNLWFERIFAPPWMHVVSHAALYAVLAGLGALLVRQRGRSYGWFVAGVMLVGVLQELIQTALAGRPLGPGEWFDLGVDASGSLLGLAAFTVVGFLRKRSLE